MPKTMLKQTRTRDNAWLFGRMSTIWARHFSDIPRANLVLIKFGRYSRLRLGSIKLERSSGKTYITISGMFKDAEVPIEVVDHTIAHELCHYTHGFSSPLKRMHRFPHEGGVIKKEMQNRGLMYLFLAYKEWSKGYREELKKQYKPKVKWRIF
jgi:hypothetical protein